MTRYENITRKLGILTAAMWQAAHENRWDMAALWARKANELDIYRYSLTIAEAEAWVE